jgi:hypothetical protein
MQVLAQVFNLEKREASDLVDVLADLFEQALPERVEVTRGGWFWSKTHPVEKVVIRFDGVHYDVSKNRHGVSVKQHKISAGVRLKTNEVTMQQCIDDVVKQLSDLAEKHGNARSALNKFMAGR